MIRSPFSYTGNKFKLLNQLEPLFPTDCETFFDMFCGGCAVGINQKNKYVVLNDISPHVTKILTEMRLSDSGENFVNRIKACIEKYGIAVDDPAGFHRIRDAYNAGTQDGITLFTMILHAYNSLFRFNSQGEYNAPNGANRSWFNPQRQKVTLEFVDALLSKEIEIYNGSYSDVPLSQGFIYCDPPYLITSAVYNGDWSSVDEYALYSWLDERHAEGYKFGVSNVMYHKGKVNIILKEWASKYTTHVLDFTYATSFVNKRQINKEYTTHEVFVCNY